MKAPAYPVREQSGLIWTYIGPKELEPPFRTFEFDTVPAENRVIFRCNRNAKWLPLMEGGLDSSHIGILHTNDSRPAWGAKQRGEGDGANVWDNLAPVLEIEDTEFGYHYCAFRNIPGVQDKRVARLTPTILPYARMISYGDEGPEGRPKFLDGGQNFSMEVPMDDNETATYTIAYSTKHPMDYDQVNRIIVGFDDPQIDQVKGEWFLDWSNRLGQDRSIMKTNWSGALAHRHEDFMVSVSTGDDWDCAKEHLVTSDIAVARFRQRLLDAIRRCQAGEAPPGVDIADMTEVRTFGRVVAASQHLSDLAPAHRRLLAAE
jgi:phthalate 4,5-dioxygenase oxygenase subunit